MSGNDRNKFVPLLDIFVREFSNDVVHGIKGVQRGEKKRETSAICDGIIPFGSVRL